MRSMVFAAVLLIGASGFALPPYELPSVEAQGLWVIDEDTIVVKILSRPESLASVLFKRSEVVVWCIGIDAPESKEPGYEEATAINRLLVEGRKVYLELDKTYRDHNGRLLAYVYLDQVGHFMVNLALVTSTFYRAYPFENTPQYNQCFLSADVNVSGCAPRSERIPAEQASRYYGKEVWVCGVVASVSCLSYGRIFLNFGKPYPNQVFTAMIDEKYTSFFDQRFGSRWENKLVGQIVCVYGVVKEYQGKPEVLPTAPTQLRSSALGVPCPRSAHTDKVQGAQLVATTCLF